MRAVRGRLEPALATGTQAAGLHHPAYPLLSWPGCRVRQGHAKSSASHRHPSSGEDSLDVHSQGRVAEPAVWLVRANLRRLPQSVLMIAAGADLQDTALGHDRPGATMSLDKGIPHRDSLAKYTAAFLGCPAPCAPATAPPSAARSPSVQRSRLCHGHHQAGRLRLDPVIQRLP